MLRQQHALLVQILPLLYVVFSICLGVFSSIFWNELSTIFSIYIPAVLFCFFFIRLLYWVRYLFSDDYIPLSIIQKDIKSVIIIGPLLSLGYTGFIVSYLEYAQTNAMMMVVIVIWTLALISSFCLNSLPLVSMTAIAGVSIPVSLAFIQLGDPVMIRLSAILVIISMLVFNVNRTIYRTFLGNVIARWKLVRKNEIAERAREAATRIAFSDQLTGLPNRRSFNIELEQRITALAGKRIRPFGVAILDLDGFKPVNDIHGHAVGDAVLVKVGKRLAEALGESGFMARLGGDEFAIIADEIDLPDDAFNLGEKLCDSLRGAFTIESVVAHISSSCGFYLVTEGSANPGCVIERADLALYKAKSDNRGGTVIFSTEMAEFALHRSKTEQALRKAILDNTIEMYFQPIVDLADGSIAGMEALARWQDSELGFVSPARFIPIAEQSGLIAELTENLFQKAIAAAKLWPDHVYLSFNLSADHLTRPSVGLKILSTMLSNRFDPGRLEIEVTETAIMRDVQRARTTITNLKQAGVSIALDDFGAGYSSMGQIRDLPFNKIKIDKSFIDGVCTSNRTRNLISSIIYMCARLSINCVAEGIENQEQHALLLELGCKLGQGYLFARPMSDQDTLAALEMEKSVPLVV